MLIRYQMMGSAYYEAVPMSGDQKESADEAIVEIELKYGKKNIPT